jgi:hypothetical protein
MKIVYAIGLGFLALVTLQPYCLADDAASNRQERFIRGMYVRYQRFIMLKTDLKAARDGGPSYIDHLLRDLQKHIPEYSEWLRRGVINENPNLTSAMTLHRLADNDIPFRKEQIDGIILGLVHPDPGVVENLQTTLTQVFGVSFIDERYDHFYRSEEVRSGYRAAWQKFWKQNRDRYGQGLPLIVNDLSLDAHAVGSGAAMALEIETNNYGDRDWRVFVEAPGKRGRDESPPPDGGQDWPLSILIGEREERPIFPAGYYLTPRPLTPAEQAALPDRAAHVETVTIPARKRYRYTMNLAEAFPKLPLGGDAKVVVKYCHTYVIRKDDHVWRGELRSLPITLGGG